MGGEDSLIGDNRADFKIARKAKDLRLITSFVIKVISYPKTIPYRSLSEGVTRAKASKLQN